MTNIIIYLCAINIMTFLLYGLDKQKAKRHKWRIPEATLLGVALAGGSIGAFLGMYIFHHKTKKAKFYIGVPMFFVMQAVGIIVIQTRLL
ncbi:hypothetical protein HMPREF9477_01237 [Lachnospiraceae bacterium 2_1_46FAA]|nr:hypothetical protein HMPREF9477_01237 [Lachnospiraceae bacterium 2_1_46FAA]